MAVSGGARTPGPPVVPGRSVRGIRIGTLLLGVLCAGPSARLHAQSIAVVVNPNFRPTAALQPHVRYIVGADSADGTALLQELAVPPVAFAGSVRIEGVQPGARAPERRPFADTVRFDADGRVQLLLADAAGRPPMAVEVVGARGAAAGRIAITAPRWPLGRAMLVTIAPADLYELAYRGAGFGVRDRIRVDDRTGFAFLTDSSAGPTTVAIGFGRATRGRIQSDLGQVVVARDFGGETGRERRTVGALTMIIDPARGDDGTAHVEILFGVGDTETDATRAAHAASDEPPLTPRTPALRWHTPSTDADLLVRHLFAAAGWMLDWDLLDGERSIPSSSVRPVLRAADAWLGTPIVLQRGDTAAVCGSYRLLRGPPTARSARSEVAIRLGPRGRYLAVTDTATTEADAALVLLGYACYAATRDASLLRADFPRLAAAVARAVQGDAEELAPEAVERLAELDDELARLAGDGRRSSGDSLRAEAARLAGRASSPLPGSLWRLVFAEAQRGIGRDYGRLSESGGPGGASLAAAGTFVALMAGEVFGVTEYLDRLEVAPQLAGIADDQLWQLDGWLLNGGDTLGISYRPADRSAVIRLTAAQRRRLVLRFPWLAATSCVTARRGAEGERLPLVQQADGSFYVDVRATFDPAEIRVLAESCGGS